MVLKLGCVSESLEGLLEHRLLGCTSRVPESVGLECDLGNSPSHRCPGEAHAAGLGITIQKPCLDHFLLECFSLAVVRAWFPAIDPHFSSSFYSVLSTSMILPSGGHLAMSGISFDYHR